MFEKIFEKIFIKMEPLMKGEKIKEVRKFHNQFSKAEMDYFEFWKVNTFMHWDFWVSLIITIVPWIIWSKFHKKQSRHRLLYVAFYVIIISSFLDFLGVALGAWVYTGKVLPTIPSYVPWDFTLLPVTIISFIQYKPQIAPWLKGIVFSAITAFIGETLFELTGFYYSRRFRTNMNIENCNKL